MTPRPRHIPLGLLAALVSLDVAVRLLEKAAVVGSMGTRMAFALALVKQPWWWLGLALGPLQLWVWTRILARTKLSIAYPLSSIGYPLTMAAAWLLFGEHLSWQVWLGAAFMTSGVAIVGSEARPPAYSLERRAEGRPREHQASITGLARTPTAASLR